MMKIQDINLKSLTYRLEKVERQNKRLKITGIILIFLWMIIGSRGVAICEKAVPIFSDEVVRANQFHLMDNGKIRAKLSTVYGGPVLSFYNESEKILLSLNVTAGNPMLSLSGKTGKPLIQLGILGGQLPMVIINDQDGKPRLTLGLRGDTNNPRIALLNAKGNIIWEAGASGIK